MKATVFAFIFCFRVFMRYYLTLFLVVLMAGITQAQTIFIDKENKTIEAKMTPLQVHVGGRVVIEPLPAPRFGNSYTHQWPGVYFEADFNGTSLFLKFNDDDNEYRLILDDQQPQPLAQLGNVEIALTELSPSRHHIRLEKVTESIENVGAFQGFYVPSPKNAEIFPARKRQIEFIGDSNMTGYGLRSSSRTCTQEEVRLLSDTQQSYPALVAKEFSADYQVNAISGRGMVRNYDGFEPEIALPKIYPFALLNKTAPYSDKSWKPQITLIALGANDFATDLKSGETWKSDQELFSNYMSEFERFLKELYQRNPETAVLISWSDMISYMGDSEKILAEKGQQTIIKKAKKLGFITVAFLPMDDLKLSASACDYHASASDHLKRRKWLVDYLITRETFWQSQ
jgi:lysophospholipase L1-like esterase